MPFRRVLSYVFGVLLLVLATWVGGWIYVTALSVIAFIAFYELVTVLRSHGIELVKEVAVPCSVALIIGAACLSGNDLALLFEAVVFVTVTGSLAFHLIIRTFSRRVDSVGLTVFSVLYIGWLLSFFVLLRNLRIAEGAALPFFGRQIGCALLFQIYLSTWACESAAAYVGRRWGKLRIFPTISPGKTLEGVIAGLTAACLVSCLCGLLPGMDRIHALFLGFILGVGGQLGDLLQSLIKRDLQVRDFGALIPGSSGVLDQFAGLLINVPLGYFYVLVGLSTR